VTKLEIIEAFDNHIEIKLGRNFLLSHPQRQPTIDKLITDIKIKEFLYFSKQSHIRKLIEDAADNFIERVF
jgi:hypothetical protein